MCQNKTIKIAHTSKHTKSDQKNNYKAFIDKTNFEKYLGYPDKAHS